MFTECEYLLGNKLLLLFSVPTITHLYKELIQLERKYCLVGKKKQTTTNKRKGKKIKLTQQRN